MKNLKNKIACTRMCRIMGAVAGVLFALVLMVLLGWGIVLSLFLGLVLGVFSGALFVWLLCSDLGGRSGAATPRPVAAGAAVASTVMAGGTGAAVTAPAVVGGAGQGTQAAAEPVVQQEPPVRVPAVSDLPDGQDPTKEVASEVQQAPEPTPSTVAKSATVTAVSAKPEKSGVTDGATTHATDDDTGIPLTLTSARAGGADNLKLISGVGPKLEQTLNGLGIFHFDQIAAWGTAEIAWVDDRLRFKGRIERDDWPGQAGVLAAGGETEFSSRSKKS